MTGWDNTDLRALRRIGVGLGAFQVIEIKENSVTEQAPENDMWDGEEDKAPAQSGATFPEHPDNPHEAPLSVNFKPGGTPQLTVRGRTVAEHMALLQDVQSSGLLTLIASVNTAFGGQGAAPAPQAPAQGPVPVPQGVNYNPQMPPPNQPYPGQPAWQQAGAPQASGWAGGQQQGGGFARNAQQGGGQGNKPQPKTQPPGWYRTDKNSGPGADFWKSWREQNQQALKGKIQWGGASTFWVAPDVAAMVSGAGFVVVAA